MKFLALLLLIPACSVAQTFNEEVGPRLCECFHGIDRSQLHRDVMSNMAQACVFPLLTEFEDELIAAVADTVQGEITDATSQRIAEALGLQMLRALVRECDAFFHYADTARAERMVEDTEPADIDSLTNAIAAAPTPEKFFARAREHFRNGDHAQATADLDRAIAADTDDADAYLMRGYIAEQGGNYDQALRDYKTATAIHSKGARSFLFLLICERKME